MRTARRVGGVRRAAPRPQPESDLHLASHPESDTQNAFVRLPTPLPALADPTRAKESVSYATLHIELPSPSGPIHILWPLADAALSVDWLRALMR